MLVHATSIALVPASAAEPKRQLRATLIDNTGRVVADHPGLPVPLAEDQLPSCELDDQPAASYPPERRDEASQRLGC